MSFDLRRKNINQRSCAHVVPWIYSYKVIYTYKVICTEDLNHRYIEVVNYEIFENMSTTGRCIAGHCCTELLDHKCMLKSTQVNVIVHSFVGINDDTRQHETNYFFFYAFFKIMYVFIGRLYSSRWWFLNLCVKNFY